MRGLTWQLKDSFVDYIQGSPGGRIVLARGAQRTDDGSFFFPEADAAPSDAVRQLSFTGAVTFIGHHGMLALVIENPSVLNSAGNASLTIADPELDPPRRDIASLGWGRRSKARIDFDAPILTVDGADLFFDNYRPGTTLAPLSVHTRGANQQVTSQTLERQLNGPHPH